MNDNQIVKRATEAAMVLENEAYKEAMSALKRQVIESWKDCPVRDREGQLLLLQLAKLADKFESTLQGMIENGKLAARKIDLDSVRNESTLHRFSRKVVHG